MLRDNTNSLKYIGSAIVLVALHAYAADSTGFIRFEECSVMASNHLHLETFRNRTMEKPIVLRLPGALETLPDGWHDVPGMDCPAPNQCEPATSAKVQVTRVSYASWFGSRKRVREVEGNFAVVLHDGMKLEGSFKAKTRKPSDKLICE